MRVLLVSLFLLPVAFAAGGCRYCASLGLASNWQLTGLPKRPNDLLFTEDCLRGESSLEKDCNNNCFELLIPNGGMYETVKGCYDETFVWNELKPTEATPSCVYGESQADMVANYENANKSAVFAFRITGVAVPGEDAAAGYVFYNDKLTIPAVKVKNIPNIYDEPKAFMKAVTDSNANIVCSPNTNATRECYKCVEYDKNGGCDESKRDKCNGAYCTYTQGKIGGIEYEDRGCATITPLPMKGSVCSWMDTSNVVPSLGMRTKRDLTLSYRVNQCTCNDKDRCNPAAVGSLSLMAAALSVAAALPFF